MNHSNLAQYRFVSFLHQSVSCVHETVVQFVVFSICMSCTCELQIAHTLILCFFLITHFMCKQHVCWCVDMYSLLKWCEFSVTFIIFVRVQLNIVFVTCGFHNPLVLGLFHVKDTLVHRHQSSPLAQYSCASSKDVPVSFKSYFTMLCQSCSVFPAFACSVHFPVCDFFWKSIIIRPWDIP